LKRGPFGISAVFAVALLAGDAFLVAQPAPSTTEFIAFRVDDRHVVAVVGETGDGPDDRPGREAISTFGFPFRDAEPAVGAKIPPPVAAAKQWTIDLGVGRRLTAEFDRLVQGSASCTGLAGVLLRVDDPQRQFLNTREKHYVAEPSGATRPASRERPARPAPIDRPQIDSLLGDLLTRELPAMTSGAKEEIDRFASSESEDHRAWARSRRQIDDAMASGKAQLQYDVQSFSLRPDDVPLYFVRAEWRVGGSPAFGAALWIKGGAPLTIVEQNLGPAHFIRLYEFQGELSRQLFGMVLNVVDRDGDGWREIVFARGGYESMEIALLELTPTGFAPTGIGYTYGC